MKDLQEITRIVTPDDVGKYCVNVSDARDLLAEVARLTAELAAANAKLAEYAAYRERWPTIDENIKLRAELDAAEKLLAAADHFQIGDLHVNRTLDGGWTAYRIPWSESGPGQTVEIWPGVRQFSKPAAAVAAAEEAQGEAK